MCSANASEAGLAGRDRILAVAIDLIGRDGARAATVRRVAEAAAVSPALVMHHFGSKDGLIAACDETAMTRMDEAMTALVSAEREVAIGELLASDNAGAALIYIGRAMQDGGEPGRVWFDRMMAMTEQGLAGLRSVGAARDVPDPQMSAVLLLAMDIGVVVLRAQVERYLGRDLTDPTIVRRWGDAEFDLLTHGILAGPALTDTVPTDTALTDTVPTETLPTETLPTETLPTETLPTDAALTETVPTDTVPTDSTVTDAAPAAPTLTEIAATGDTHPTPPETT